MMYGSVCSGIEAASVAWRSLGMGCAFVSEIEKFPCAVLTHHYPDVPNHGDMTKFKDWPDESIDLLVGGTPCQSFSVAGLRKGMADPRGNLALTFLAIADRYRPRWLLWENVPGVLSSNGGRDFGSILGGMVELGYGIAYRVLDAQYFGVPQRRRRVFVVGYLGDARRAAAVLFERHSLSGNPAPRRETGEDVAGTLGGGSQSRGWNNSLDVSGAFIPISAGTVGARAGSGTDDLLNNGLIARCVTTREGSRQDPSIETLIPALWSITPSNSNKDYNARLADKAQAVTAGGNRPSARDGDLVAFSCKDHGADVGELSPTLRSMGHDGSHANAGGQVAIARTLTRRYDGSPSSNGQGYEIIHAGIAVRRLTPRECERLQGFPDDYTLITYRGKPAADGPRYKALGNSMAVPVMRWIGERILQSNTEA